MIPVTTYMTALISADSPKEALERAKDSDGEEFNSGCNSDREWCYDRAEIEEA